MAGKLTDIKFLIIQNAKHDFLLGMDWIESTKCILNPSKRLLWFEEDIKETFILSSEKNSNDE